MLQHCVLVNFEKIGIINTGKNIFNFFSVSWINTGTSFEQIYGTSD